MTAKQYLSQLKRLDMMIDQKLNQMADLREKATAIGSFDYSKERVQTSPDMDARYAGTIQRIADLEKEIDGDVDKFVNAKHKIARQIQEVEDQRYSGLLYRRYVEYKSFQVIEKEMHYSQSYIARLHRQALQTFERMYPLTLLIQGYVEIFDAMCDTTKEDT